MSVSSSSSAPAPANVARTPAELRVILTIEPTQSRSVDKAASWRDSFEFDERQIIVALADDNQAAEWEKGNNGYIHVHHHQPGESMAYPPPREERVVLHLWPSNENLPQQKAGDKVRHIRYIPDHTPLRIIADRTLCFKQRIDGDNTRTVQWSNTNNLINASLRAFFEYYTKKCEMPQAQETIKRELGNTWEEVLRNVGDVNGADLLEKPAVKTAVQQLTYGLRLFAHKKHRETPEQAN